MDCVNDWGNARKVALSHAGSCAAGADFVADIDDLYVDRHDRGDRRVHLGLFQIGPLLALKFIKLVDIALLALVFYLVAIGIYRLFIDPNLDCLNWMKVDNLDDLKNKLVRVIVLVLAVSFLSEVIEGEPSSEIAYLGVGIAAVVASLTYFSSQNTH